VVFRLSGAYEPIMNKNRFKISKKLKENFAWTSKHFMFAHKFFAKINKLCGLCKTDKKCFKQWIHMQRGAELHFCFIFRYILAKEKYFAMFFGRSPTGNMCRLDRLRPPGPPDDAERKGMHVQ
jgi:hypothetical protein